MLFRPLPSASAGCRSVMAAARQIRARCMMKLPTRRERQQLALPQSGSEGSKQIHGPRTLGGETRCLSRRNTEIRGINVPLFHSPVCPQSSTTAEPTRTTIRQTDLSPSDRPKPCFFPIPFRGRISRCSGFGSPSVAETKPAFWIAVFTVTRRNV